VRGQLHEPADLLMNPPGGTHKIGGGVDRISGLDDVEKRREECLALSGNRTQIPRYRPRDARINILRKLYYFTCSFVWVWNLVPHLKGRVLRKIFGANRNTATVRGENCIMRIFIIFARHQILLK
jgi:hypothetical protein